MIERIGIEGRLASIISPGDKKQPVFLGGHQPAIRILIDRLYLLFSYGYAFRCCFFCFRGIRCFHGLPLSGFINPIQDYFLIGHFFSYTVQAAIQGRRHQGQAY